MDRRVWLNVGDDRRVLAREQCYRAWTDEPETRDAIDYLQRLVGNAAMMARLRAMLLAADNTLLLERRNDRQIVNEIAARIRNKRMCLEPYPVRLEPWPDPVTSQTTPAREPVMEQRAPASAPPPLPSAPPQTDTENLDQAAQAQTLKRAAQDGTPLCEECGKARQQQGAA